MIDYDEVEHKLSNYLTCTIRTNSRQKYNYLSDYYVELNKPVQQFGMGKVSNPHVKTNNFFSMKEVPQNNFVERNSEVLKMI